MIISNKYRYLFVELPRTGSSAIAAELRLNYDGQRILKKHSTYRDFLKTATSSQKDYFVFSCIRNPLDKTVSLYYKYKTRHSDLYTNAERLSHQNVLMRSLMRRQYHFVAHDNRTFEEFFLRFFRLPYNDWASLDHAQFRKVIRFEKLNGDFLEVLSEIGITPVRSLPMVNVTRKGEKNFWSHYERPDVRRRAIWVFAPYAKLWGFEFPEDWRVEGMPAGSMAAFRAANVLRNFYWRYLRV